MLRAAPLKLLRDGTKRQHGWPDQAVKDRAQGQGAISSYDSQLQDHFHGGAPSELSFRMAQGAR